MDVAKQTNVVVDGVSLCGGKAVTFLDQITAITGGTMLEVDSTRNLRPSFGRALEEFHGRYLLSY